MPHNLLCRQKTVKYKLPEHYYLIANVFNYISTNERIKTFTGCQVIGRLKNIGL